MNRFFDIARSKGLISADPAVVQEQLAAVMAARPQPAAGEEEVVFRAPPTVEPTPPAPHVPFQPVASLTACLETAECPAMARRIYQLLLELALHSIRARGLPVRPDVAVFHLPSELLASHFEVCRQTIWRNVKPLVEAGVLDERDHYGSLNGRPAVTGKIWAVSIVPDRVLRGLAAPVKVRIQDLRFPWRDLTSDVKAGRTAYALTRTDERQEAEKAARKAREGERAKAFERAALRLSEREAARAAGAKVPHGRRAATLNAAATREARKSQEVTTEKARPKRLISSMQQSREGLKAVKAGELIQWTLAPFSTPSDDVTVTVARALSGGLDAIFTIRSLTMTPKRDRNAVVESAARALAAAFDDTKNLRFWCWLIWQLLRGAAQGQDYIDDVAHMLARVLHDLRHDETLGRRTQRRPAALVVKELDDLGVMDALRELERYRVGGKPRAA